MYRFSDSEFSAAEWRYYLHRDGRRGRDRIFASRRVARGADAVVGTQRVSRSAELDFVQFLMGAT